MSDSTIAQEERGGSVVFNSENAENVDFSGAETMEMDDWSASTVKKCERCLLKRVLSKELGDHGSDRRLLVIGVHAVLLESGFVGIDSATGKRVNRLQVADEWPSNFLSVSLWYTLPELLEYGSGDFGNAVDSVVLRFQSLGHFVHIYGSLSKAAPGLHKVFLNDNRFVPAISLGNSDSVDGTNEEDGYPETQLFEFWKIVKDGLALPLLIDLCERAGLMPPPCFMRLPADLKLKILDYLRGDDLAKVACVCSELRYLSSTNELWKRKFVEECGRITVRQGYPKWKGMFSSCWEIKRKGKRLLEAAKKRKPEAGLWGGFASPLRPLYHHERHPFDPSFVVGGDYDLMSVAYPPEPSSWDPQFHRLRRSSVRHYPLGGSRD